MLDFSLMAYKNEIIDDLCNLIRIDSVKSDAQSHMPYGKKVFEWRFLKKLKIELSYDPQSRCWTYTQRKP